MGSKSQWGPCIPYICKFLTTKEVRDEGDTEKNTHWIWLTFNLRLSAWVASECPYPSSMCCGCTRHPLQCDHFLSTVNRHLFLQSVLICPPEISGNYQQTHIVVKQEKFGKEMATEFCLWSTFHTYRVLLHDIKSYMGLTALFPSERSCAMDFYCP
jgi:hypothetical protein